MNRQECAKKLILEDIETISNAVFKCEYNTRSHFMLGGLLYFATIISGAVDWCDKAGMKTACFADKTIIDKLRAKVKLYSSDSVIPFEEQKQLMNKIVSIEKQYWIDLQAESGKWCPKFIIPDVGSYKINGHYIGNTLEYAYEYSPLNPSCKPISVAIGGQDKESSLAYLFANDMGMTIQELYTKISGKRYTPQDCNDNGLIISDYDFRMGNRPYFKRENAIFAFNLCCRINYLLEMFFNLCGNDSLLVFRMMYITFYHLEFDLKNFDLDFVHYDMPYRDSVFRNIMAHYSLYGKIDDCEIIDNVIGYGLFEKYFNKPFVIVNQAIVEELIKTRDSLEEYVKF